MQSLVYLGLLIFVYGSYLAQKYAPPPKPRFVGIDLGTTYSCVGAFHAGSGHVEIIPDAQGRRTTPSVVALTTNGGGFLVGAAAKAQAAVNTRGTVYEAKHFMGQQYTPEIQRLAERFPFGVESGGGGGGKGEGGDARIRGGGGDDTMTTLTQNTSSSPSSSSSSSSSPVVIVLDPTTNDNESSGSSGTSSQVVRLAPEEVGALIVGRLKAQAEAHLGVPVKRVVMSAPAEFNRAQRDATARAGQLAGLEVLRVISEPTAAAMAYGVHERARVSLVLVYDFGGGTLDVSLLAVSGGTFYTQAIAGNSRLGGEDLTQGLLHHVLKQYAVRYGGGGGGGGDDQRNVQPRNPGTMQRLLDACDAAKLTLSVSDRALITVPLTREDTLLHTHDSSSGQKKDRGDDDGVHNDVAEFSIEVTRSDFEEANAEAFSQLLTPVERVLSRARRRAEEVDEVVLVGGSTRIPRVRKTLKEYFGGRSPNTNVNPDEAVAIGVAIQAGIMASAWPMRVSAVEVPFEDEKIEL